MAIIIRQRTWQQQADGRGPRLSASMRSAPGSAQEGGGKKSWRKRKTIVLGPAHVNILSMKTRVGILSPRTMILPVLGLLLLSLFLLVSGSQARDTGGVAGQSKSVIIGSAVQPDPHTHKLAIGVLAFRSSKAVSVEFRGQVHKMKIWKRGKANTTWVWSSNYAFKQNVCYDYRVIVTTAKGTRSVDVSSKTKGNNSSYCFDKSR